jgi:hypothetical protein
MVADRRIAGRGCDHDHLATQAAMVLETPA